MKLPSKFQFRLSKEAGYTHTAKLVGDNYEIKWARGFESYFLAKHSLRNFAIKSWSESSVKWQIECGSWIIVDQPESKQEDALPDEFYFTVDGGNMPWYKAASEGNVYRATWAGDEEGTTYPVSCVEKCLRTGDWKILNKKPRTAEQKRANKEYCEQIAALEQSIKLNQQDIEHKERLIASYEERKEFLLSKIMEEF